MNSETGSEPESPKKRGRIPHSAWPEILERYTGGTTLSAIAREFECTPSAISYIIKKAEAAASGQGELNVSDANADQPPAAAAEAPVAVAPSAPPAPVVETTAPAAASTTEVEAPTDRGAASRLRPRLTRPEARTDDAATAPTAPAPTETLRLNRPEPAPQPVAAPPVAAPAPVATATDAPRPAASGTGPVPPVDAVEGRLRDTAKACITAYRGWRQQPNEGTIQSLSETVHELRKALSRIEIDMSASRREEQAIRPIPIPAHRASRRPQ